MMASSSDLDTIELLNRVSIQLNRYLSSSIFVFGVVGNILNCLLLSQRTLRSNPCALLFLSSSVAALISILFGLPFRILAGWELDPTAKINWICRLRAFMMFSTRNMSTWLIMFATIDRWLLSSTDVHRRQMSSLKHVTIQIITSIMLSIVSYGHMLDCYDANIRDQPLECYGKTETCRVATDLIYALITVMIPLIAMITFGLMTISNVHQVRKRVEHRVNLRDDQTHEEQRHSHPKRVDHHLFRMLLVQVLFLIVLCIPQAIQKIYITVKPFGTGSSLEDAVKIFMYNIEILLAFIASSMPFYIYTLSGGTVFRKALVNSFHTMWRKLCR